MKTEERNWVAAEDELPIVGQDVVWWWSYKPKVKIQHIWQDQPTEDGYWLMFDPWLNRPELMKIDNFRTLNPDVWCIRTGRKIEKRNLLKKSKWFGPITPPKED